MKERIVPTCVGFIMDGNRRWAKAHGLSSLEGHHVGYKTFRNLVEIVYTKHIPHIVCYAFSTENWKRTEEEVGYLMELVHKAFQQFVDDLAITGNTTNLRVIGDCTMLPRKLQKTVRDVEARNINDPHLTVWVAISYGGRDEIVHAVNSAVRAGDEVTMASFGDLLFTRGMPDPDLIIRTGGEKRLSNFLPWQSVYSELFFTDTLWPDFGETEFQSILDAYGERTRRFGR